MPPNPHPVGYHALLAQIALEHHKSGGADINAEVARRFLSEGVDSRNPPPVIQIQDPTVYGPPAAVNAPEDVEMPPDYSGGTTPSQKAGMDQSGPMNPNTDAQPAQEIHQPLPPNEPQEATQNTEPTVDVEKVKPEQPAAKPVSRGTGSARAPAQPSDTERQIQEGTDEKTQSAEDVADVAKQRALQEGPEQRDIANQQQELQNRNNTVQQFVNENQKRLLQKQEMLTDAYAGATVQSQRDIWQGMDTGHKILAGLSLMLSGNGDGSPVIRAMNQDIDRQKEQIERTGKAAGMVGKLVDEYRNMGLDSSDAMERAVLTATHIGLQRAAATAAQFKGPEAGAAVLGQIGQNTLEGAQHVQANRESISRISLQRAQAAEAAQNAATSAYNLGKAKKFGTYVENQTGVPGAPPGGLVQDAEGNTGVSLRGDEGAKAYIAETAPQQQIQQHIKNIDALLKSGGVRNRSAIISEKEALKASVLSAYQLKDSPKAQEIADHLVGSPEEVVENPVTGGWSQKRAALLGSSDQAMQESAARNQIQFKKQPQVLQRPVLNPIGKKKHG